MPFRRYRRRSGDQVRAGRITLRSLGDRAAFCLEFRYKGGSPNGIIAANIVGDFLHVRSDERRKLQAPRPAHALGG